jgi:CrcB protein
VVGERSMSAVLAVFVGGIIGTLARFGLDLWWPHETLGSLSVSTAFVNVVGSFALGFLVGGMWKRPGVPEWVKAGVGPGVLGSFTTMSGIALNLIAGAGEGKWVDALLALSVSLVAGLAAAWLGLTLGARTSSAGSAR